MFQDFQLSITHLGENRYFLRTEKVAAGVPLAEEQVEWAVDDWLAEARHLMNDPLSRLLQGTGRLSEQNQLITPDSDQRRGITAALPAATNLLEFGEQLYHALFTGSLKDSWSKAQAIAHNQNQILRLRLGCKESRLLSLPWEVINATDAKDFEVQGLTTGIETSFSRYHSKTHGSADAPSMEEVHEQTLKILMVLASPADQERLELRQEATHLQSELEKETAIGTPALELTILDNPGRQELTEILEQGQYQVFHYAGHSNLGHFGGDIYLVNRATGLTEPFAGDDLAGLLVNNGVQFAVFNSCHGADGITGLKLDESTEKSLAQALVRRGIPAVLAMSAQIPDQVALTFTRLLYRNLHQGYPIDFSLGRVRQGLISAYGSNQLYWALPVLYMNPIFHGLLQHRPLNREGLAELLHLSDGEVSALSPEDEDRLAIANLPTTNEAFWEDEDDASLFAPPPDRTDGEDTAFIKGILSEISSDLQDIKGGKNTAKPEPRGLVITNTHQSFKQVFSRYQMPIAIGAAAAIAFGGFAYWQRDSSINIRTPAEQTVSVNQNSDFAPLDSATLVEIARKQKDNWQSLRKVSTELLDRQANPFAYEVLEEIARENEEKHDYAELSFLRGRLAWQTALKGEDNMYSVEDARRAWETAQKEDPDSVAYLNALGFAYYAEENYAVASDTWFKAFNLSETVAVADLDLAQTFAGLALSFYQEAQAGSGQSQSVAGNKVGKMRDSAISIAPEQMSTSALAQNWLWSEQAIADWQKLQDLE